MSKNGLGKFIAGATLGACLGLLFAPKSGKETRKDLKKKGKELIDDIKEIDPKEIKSMLEEKVSYLKKELENLNKETAMEKIKSGANALMKKCDELIDIAKEKSAPIVEKAANDIREKTIDVLKSTIDKLEEKPKKTKKS